MLTSANDYWTLATSLSASWNHKESRSKNHTASGDFTNKNIVVIDDDPTQRLIARQDLKAVTRYATLPDTPAEVMEYSVNNVGLVIVDRWLGNKWREAADAFIQGLPSGVVVWEWTADEWSDSTGGRVSRVIYKQPGKLIENVRQWIGSGRQF